MGNMSYCRFRNTLSDLRECRDALSGVMDLDQIDGEEEQRAAKHLIRLCREIADMWDGEE